MSCILHWIDVPSRLLFLLYPPLSLFFSFYFMLTPVGSVLYFWLPYFLGYLLLTEWINGGTRSSFWSEVYETVVAFPLALVAGRSLVDPRGGKFKVSPKGESTKGIQVNWTLALPLMGIAALSIAALVKTFWSGVMQTFDPEFAAINITWTCYNLGMLSVSIQACIDVPQERKYLRFDHRVPFGLRLDSRAATGVTENLSEQGGLLNFSEPISAEEISPTAHLSLPELGLFDVPIKIHRKDKDSLVRKIGVEYASLTLIQQRRIVEFLFSRPEHWKKGSSIPQIKTLSGYLRSILRLYPLAETRDMKSP
jgi:cellulose synthase (UDP-forming)